MTRRLCAPPGATTVLGLALASWGTLATAQAPRTPAFSNAPMLVDGRLPVPNVVLAIDGGPHSAQLPLALQRGFGAARAADGSMRLAWQVAGQCEALPDPDAPCLGRNALQALDDRRRTELGALALRLAASPQRQHSGTSAPSLLAKASDYLHNANDDPPPRSSRLQCRKSHVLLATPYPAATPPSDASEDRVAPGDSVTPPLLHRVDSGAADPVPRLSDAIDTLLSQSQSMATQTVASLATGNSTGVSAPVALFAARFDAQRWSGEVAAQLISDGDGRRIPLWGQREDAPLPHTSASLLDKRDPATRIILTSSGAGSAIVGTPFRWPQLAPWQQSALAADDVLGPQRLDYLRGERAFEQSNGGNFRNRGSRQADSVNASLWHLPGTEDTSAPLGEPMLFVGSNGGMLHAFSANTGVESFAYVPQGAYAGLAALTRPGYRHQYLVDGSPWTAQMVDQAGRSRTLVAGFMGAGGRGYFVLDVTDPIGSQSEAFAAARMVVLDTTAGEDPDIGRITAAPVREPVGTWQLARLNNGRWAMVIGNGYGSERQQAVLLIQFLEGRRELLKLPAGKAGGNGLSAARLVDLDGDQSPDIAYAGDLLGQLWKFDLTGGETGQWKVAAGGHPLLLAKDAEGTPQAITAAPWVAPHPLGGRMVVLGTGRLLDDADRGSIATQSIYGILDSDDGAPEPVVRSDLVRQAVAPEPVGTSSGRQLWTSTANPVVTEGAAARRGWYVDLPATGERVIANPQRFDGKLVDVISMAPSAAFRQTPVPESCEAPATRHFRTTLNVLDGARPRSQLYGEPGTALNASRIELGGVPSVPFSQAGQERRITFDGIEQEATRRRLDFVARRAGWRQLQ